MLILSKILESNWTQGTLFAAGILIAGSDGPWFPWFNIFGILIFLCAFLFATRARLRGANLGPFFLPRWPLPGKHQGHHLK